MVYFFTSADGENGNTPIHPEVLSGDLRREMQLQGQYQLTPSCFSIIFLAVCVCSVCEQGPVDWVWHSLGDPFPGQLHCPPKGRKPARPLLHSLLCPSPPAGYALHTAPKCSALLEYLCTTKAIFRNCVYIKYECRPHRNVSSASWCDVIMFC